MTENPEPPGSAAGHPSIVCRDMYVLVCYSRENLNTFAAVQKQNAAEEINILRLETFSCSKIYKSPI